ncbi:hypothetical protein [Alloactinosynnema sp. L-07]|uniref:hypothetical protein n=1 Tax=Alloactinosynnema sp. L-07 TaxID=1653480 RepID=UPI00065EFCCC|nr:hypothetical protein [Alloactinosynnema sp. L-07]CRK59598.1 hypothetical protein [Alloactinosynnema sp. L-07]
MYVSMKLASFMRVMASTAAVTALTTAMLISGPPPSGQNHDPTPTVSVPIDGLD